MYGYLTGGMKNSGEASWLFDWWDSNAKVQRVPIHSFMVRRQEVWKEVQRPEKQKTNKE